MEKIKIDELIVVEGNDDISAVKRAVDAEVVAVHGFSVFGGRSFKMIHEAGKRCGIIILTDPDHAGDRIRARILQEVPEAGQAFISRKEGFRDGNIGVENASPESIIRALKKVKSEKISTRTDLFSMEDMINWQLTGAPKSRSNRAELGQALGLGYANTGRFLSRLNHFGISREEVMDALKKTGFSPASGSPSTAESAAASGKASATEASSTE